MAKKKTDTEKKNHPTSLRLSPKCAADIDALTAGYGISRTGAIEAGVGLLIRTLDKATGKEAAGAVASAKKAKPAS